MKRVRQKGEKDKKSLHREWTTGTSVLIPEQALVKMPQRIQWHRYSVDIINDFRLTHYSGKVNHFVVCPQQFYPPTNFTLNPISSSKAATFLR